MHVYSAYSADPQTSRAYKAFVKDDSDHLKLLFSINMLNEGVHVRGVSGIVLFRETESPIIYKQQIGRALTTGTQNTPLILDVVNNFGNLSSYGTIQSEMDEAVQRLRREGRGGEIVAERLAVVEQVRDAAALFAQLERSLNTTWDFYYEAAVSYYKEHGDLLIERKHVTPDGLHLGLWLWRQRRDRAQLSQGQIERLERIGVVWGHYADAAWEAGYAHAAQYYEAHGHLTPEAAYLCADGYPLGAWVRRMRQMKSGEIVTGRMAARRVAELEKIGMVWDVRDDAWERGYAKAKTYFEAHGNLNVPARMRTEDGYALGRWLGNQRQAREGKFQHRQLTQEQIRRLDAIGMNWGRSREERWNAFYSAARSYYRKYGNLEVHPQYKTPDGACLGMWVYDQRRNWRSGKLSDPERCARLAEIGMFEGMNR